MKYTNQIKKKSIIIVFIIFVISSLSILSFDSTATTTGSLSLYPDVDTVTSGSISQYPGSGYHYEKIDEETADDETTYIGALCTGSPIGAYERFDLQNFSVDSVSINNVTITYRGITSTSDAAYTRFNGGIYTHGGQYLDPTGGDSLYHNKAPTSWTTYSYTWTNNPYTGSAWTLQEVNDLQVSLYMMCDVGAVNGDYSVITQAYVTVNCSLPTVNTVGSKNITSSSATLEGNITDLAGLSNVSCWFVIDTTSHTVTNQSDLLDYAYYTNNISVNSTGSFEINTGNTLDVLTTYYFRAVCNNMIWGDELSFTTIGTPTVTTGSATNKTNTTATLNGELTGLGGAPNCSVWFVYDNIYHGDVDDYTYSTSKINLTGTGTFYINISGLSSGTLYYFIALVENMVGTSYGAVRDFTTLIDPPAVTTSDATDISAFSAILNGIVTSLGGASSANYWFVFDNVTHAGGDYTDYSNSTTHMTIYYPYYISTSLNGLINDTTYYFRAVTSNTGGTVCGDEYSFTTTSSSPISTTEAATNIGSGCAILHGTLTDKGVADSVSIYFKYGIVSLNNTVFVTNYTGTAPYSFYYDISGLNLTENYVYCSYVESMYGNTTGNTVSFTTEGEANVHLYYERTLQKMPNTYLLGKSYTLVITYMNDTTNYFTIDANESNISVLSNIKTARLEVNDSVFRIIVPSDSDMTFYLPSIDDVVQYYKFYIMDMSGQYIPSYSRLNLYLIDSTGTQISIHESYLSAESSLFVWLIYGHQYHMQVVTNSTMYDFGKIEADSTTEKTVVIAPNLNLDPRPFWSKVFYGYNVSVSYKNVSNSTLYIWYNDTTENTTLTHVIVENNTGYIIFNNNYTSQVFLINLTFNASQMHEVFLYVNHINFGNKTLSFYIYPYVAPSVAPIDENETDVNLILNLLDTYFGGMPFRIADLLIFGICIFSLMTFGPRYAGLSVFVTGLLYGFLTVTIGITALSGIIFIALMTFGLMGIMSSSGGG